MNLLSRKCKYAIQAVRCLAYSYLDGPITSGQIAESEGIPRKFLETILADLQKKGVLESFRGKNGGYRLAVVPRELTVGFVVRAIDGPFVTAPCLANGSSAEPCPECTSIRSCAIRSLMAEIRRSISQVLDRTTFEDLRGRRAIYGEVDEIPKMPLTIFRNTPILDL